MTVKIHQGDAIEVMRGMAGASVDSVVTDPPAGIFFMGRDWDHHKGGRDQWIVWMAEVAAECLRVCKPGSHALVWALPRTSHWTATAWENAGWEVRDRVSHLFGSGFPKSQNVGKALDKAAGVERKLTRPGVVTRSGYGEDWDSGDSSTRPRYDDPATDLAKQWDGWGTALKPSMEDWWLLRKPLIGTVVANIAAHGTGALNVDGCRVPSDAVLTGGGGKLWSHYRDGTEDRARPQVNDGKGRWPANIVTDGSDEVLEAFARFGDSRPHHAGVVRRGGEHFGAGGAKDGRLATAPTDTGTAARFFKACPWEPGELRFHYTAKASREEREIGHIAGERNGHPTVKPLALLSWLCRLITPPGGTVLDMFAGSGSTGIAADREGFNAILVERELEYVEIARRRISGDAPLLTELSKCA